MREALKLLSLTFLRIMREKVDSVRTVMDFRYFSLFERNGTSDSEWSGASILFTIMSDGCCGRNSAYIQYFQWIIRLKIF